VTEDQITTFLNECEPLLGSISSATGLAARSNVFEFPLAPPPSMVINNTAAVENELAAGIGALEWFDGLYAQEKHTFVRACVDAIDNRAADPREQWFRMLCAVADAGMRGCPDAEQLARDWSRRGASWTGDADFDTAWRSLKPGKIGVGSLIAAAKAAGLDVSPWRDTALTRLQTPSPPGAPLGNPPVTLVQQHQRDSAPILLVGQITPAAAFLPPGQRADLQGGVLTPAAALLLMNSHFFVSVRDGEVGIFRIEDDGTITFLPSEQFALLLGNIFVLVAGKTIPIAKFWLTHRDRRSCRRIVFEPSGNIHPDDYNLWRGFAVTPQPGFEKQRRLLLHIYRIICRRNNRKFKYLMKYLAWTVQNPHRHAEVVVVFKSDAEGCGKSTVGTVMLDIFGTAHGLLVDNKEQGGLVGRRCKNGRLAEV
jgi:hypothetical protein